MANISVIGAGIGGMSAAARLAKAGHQVTVYENSDRAGGKCRTEWFGDYAFDTGPSLLTLPAVYRDLFLKTGKRIEHILDIKPVDPAFNYHFLMVALFYSQICLIQIHMQRLKNHMV